MCMLGAFAETVAAPDFLTFRLDDALDAAQGAGLVLNYHTAYFSLVTRGQLQEGETVLVHGAAGGVGTATLQVAKGLGARTIAIVSDDAKEEVARRAGADEVFRSGGPWKDEVRELGRRRRGHRPGRRRPHDRLAAHPQRGRARWWSSASPGAASPRSRSTACCSTTSSRRRGWGAYVLPKPR